MLLGPVILSVFYGKKPLSFPGRNSWGNMGFCRDRPGFIISQVFFFQFRYLSNGVCCFGNRYVVARNPGTDPRFMAVRIGEPNYFSQRGHGFWGYLGGFFSLGPLGIVGFLPSSGWAHKGCGAPWDFPLLGRGLTCENFRVISAGFSRVVRILGERALATFATHF